MGRNQPGKTMAVSMDRVIAARMRGKDQKYREALPGVPVRAADANSSGDGREELEARISYMEDTNMAVVIRNARSRWVMPWGAWGRELSSTRPRVRRKAPPQR